MTMVNNLENLIPASNHFLLQFSALLRSPFLRLQLVAETLSISNCRIFPGASPSFFRHLSPQDFRSSKERPAVFPFFFVGESCTIFLQHQRKFPVVIGSQIYSKSDGSRQGDAKPHHEDVESLRPSFAVQKQGNDQNFAPEESGIPKHPFVMSQQSEPKVTSYK